MLLSCPLSFQGRGRLYRQKKNPEPGELRSGSEQNVVKQTNTYRLEPGGSGKVFLKMEAQVRNRKSSRKSRVCSYLRAPRWVRPATMRPQCWGHFDTGHGRIRRLLRQERSQQAWDRAAEGSASTYRQRQRDPVEKKVSIPITSRRNRRSQVQGMGGSNKRWRVRATALHDLLRWRMQRPDQEPRDWGLGRCLVWSR